MIKRLLLTLFALTLPASALADDPANDLADDLEGAWALRIDGATIFRFELRQIADGVWRGTWTRPDSFASNGVVFTRLEGEEELSSMAGLERDGEVELSFDDPRPGAIPDIFRFRHVDQGQVRLTYVGTGLAPYPLVAVAPGAALGPFEDDRIYDRDNALIMADLGRDMLPPAEPEPWLPAEPWMPDEEVSRSVAALAEPDQATERTAVIGTDPAADAAPVVWVPDESVRRAVAALADARPEPGQRDAPGRPDEAANAPEPEQVPDPAPVTRIGDDFLEGI